MNQFFLKFSIPKSELNIQHGDKIILTGSCFSDEISNKLKKAGHSVFANPHGTIFHPSVLAYNLMDVLNGQPDQRIFERDGLFYTWNASTLIHGKSKEELQDKLLQIKSSFHKQIQESKLLIVTFGTAWGYELNETQEIVANCHKMPAHLFTKFLSSPYELVQDWILAIEQIQAINPDLTIVFTVSPVRHVKDGLIENNLSKARLIEVVQQLTLEENIFYFPSYELIIDVLRDYRFFKEDRVHPNEEAIDFVWNKFEETYFSQQTIELNKQIEKVNLFSKHKSTDIENHMKSLKTKQLEISSKHPTVFWH